VLLAVTHGAFSLLFGGNTFCTDKNETMLNVSILAYGF